MLAFRPAAAYWNQRHDLATSRERILNLIEAVGRKADLSPFQWAQLMAMAMEFSPDLILELGRNHGNSTAAFTEASRLMGGKTRVLSLCLSPKWDERISPAIRALTGDDWFAPLTTLTANILEFDFADALKDAERVLLFWDAHGFEIAECVLTKVMPVIADRPHLALIHDLSDARYGAPGSAAYEGNRIWKGRNEWGGPRVRLGVIDSAVEQSVAALDFASRNGITLDSGDHSFHTELTSEQVAEMEMRLGPLFSRSAHWFYFSLNERPGPYYFPAPAPPIETGVVARVRAANRQIAAAVMQLVRGAPLH